MTKQRTVIALQVVAEYDDSKIKPQDFGGAGYFAKHLIDAAEIDGMEVDAGEDEWVTFRVVEGMTIVVG